MAWLKISTHKRGHCWSVLLVAWQLFVKAYWVGKVFAFFFKLFNRCIVPFKSGCIWIYCGDNIHCNGEKIPTINFKMAFLCISVENPSACTPSEMHLEQRKCKHNLSLFNYFLGGKVCFQWHTYHIQNVAHFKTCRMSNAVCANRVLIIFQ